MTNTFIYPQLSKTRHSNKHGSFVTNVLSRRLKLSIAPLTGIRIMDELSQHVISHFLTSVYLQKAKNKMMFGKLGIE